MKIISLVLSATMFVSVANSGDLTYLSNATVTLKSKDYSYKVYLDLSTKHLEGTYQTITSYSYFEEPISIDGYDGVRWWKNTFQVDCSRNVKRVTFISYLNSDGKEIVHQSMPDASDEGLQSDPKGVDNIIKPYLCKR